MFCPNCGTEYKEENERCPNCGKAHDFLSAEKTQRFEHYVLPPRQAIVFGRNTGTKKETSNGFSVAGFVLSFLGFICFGLVPIFQILGVIFSCIGLFTANKTNGTGRELSVAGLVLGILSMSASVVLFCIWE